ncbi:MAG: glycosyl transferase [Chitinophagia bacterium]|nr:glycosyl transferase [Chitinophagia bacterium]
MQGTGNGHVTRSLDVVPALMQYAEVDVLISGIQSDIALPFPVKYKLTGLGFIFGQKGGVDIGATIQKAKPLKFLKEINELPVHKYDLVINDFEPVSAWASQKKGIPCIGLSHQAAVLSDSAPLPNHSDVMGELILRNYAPTQFAYGFHFKAYNNKVFTPVIRQQIRSLNPTNKGHYTVYLPAYSDETILSVLSQIKEATWQVFSKHNKAPISIGNVNIVPVNNQAFTQSLASCAGILCGAGFEAPAEAMYLGKKVMVIPMANQYEQHCNAAGAAQLGAKVIVSLNRQSVPEIRDWIINEHPISVNFPNQTQEICGLLLHNFKNEQSLNLEEYLKLQVS